MKNVITGTITYNDELYEWYLETEDNVYACGDLLEGIDDLLVQQGRQRTSAGDKITILVDRNSD